MSGSSLWQWLTSPKPSSHVTIARRVSTDAEPSSPVSPTSCSPSGAGSPVRLDWASVQDGTSNEQHVPKLLDARGNITQSLTLTPFVLKQLSAALPSRFAYADWRLLYSTAVHGISLNTFYSRAAGCGCCLLAIKDTNNNVFGAFCSEWREPFTPPSFYGGGETFLFSIERLKDLPPLLSAFYRYAPAAPFFFLARLFCLLTRAIVCLPAQPVRIRRLQKPSASTAGPATTLFLCSRLATILRWAPAATLRCISTRICCTARRGRRTHLGMRAYAGHRSRKSSSSRRMATAAMVVEVEVMKRWISLTPLQMQQQQRRLQRLIVHPHHRNKGRRPWVSSAARCSRCGAWITRRSADGSRS